MMMINDVQPVNEARQMSPEPHIEVQLSRISSNKEGDKNDTTEPSLQVSPGFPSPKTHSSFMTSESITSSDNEEGKSKSLPPVNMLLSHIENTAILKRAMTIEESFNN